MKSTPLALMLLGWSLMLFTGCQAISKDWVKKLPWMDQTSKVQESKYQTPVKMVALWSPAMYNTPGKPATRGFGGRLYFYNSKNETVPVEGQLVVYGFNDTNKNRSHHAADRRLAFTPEQFSTHFSPTEMGASYSVWIPWDEVGNPQTEISLLPIFTASSGQVVVGQQSLNLLPGPETPNPEPRVEHSIIQTQVTYGDGVQTVGYQQPAGAVSENVSATNAVAEGVTQPAKSLDTLSIALPEDLAKRVAAAAAEAASEAKYKPESAPSAAGVPTGNNEPQRLGQPEVSGTSTAKPATDNTTARPTVARPPTERPPFPGLLPKAHSERSQLRAPAALNPVPVGGHPQTPQFPATQP